MQTNHPQWQSRCIQYIVLAATYPQIKPVAERRVLQTHVVTPASFNMVPSAASSSHTANWLLGTIASTSNTGEDLGTCFDMLFGAYRKALKTSAKAGDAVTEALRQGVPPLRLVYTDNDQTLRGALCDALHKIE